MAGRHRGRRAVFYLNDPFRVVRGLVIPASCSLPADGDQSSRRGGAPATGLLNFGPMGLGSICLASLRRVTSFGLSRPAGKVAGEIGWVVLLCRLMPFGLSRPTGGVEVLQGAG